MTKICSMVVQKIVQTSNLAPVSVLIWIQTLCPLDVKILTTFGTIFEFNIFTYDNQNKVYDKNERFTHDQDSSIMQFNGTQINSSCRQSRSR